MKRQPLKASAVVFQIILLLSSASQAQTGKGAICVAPIPVDPPTTAAPGMSCSSGNLSLKIDARKSVSWPHDESLQIEPLDLAPSHLVTVLCDGKPLQSFRFMFSEYTTRELCLFINDFYQTVQLWERAKSPWCKCK